MQRPTPLVNDYYYHIFNRGVNKTSIFFDDGDRIQFVHDLYEFNDSNPAPDSRHKRLRGKTAEIRIREPLVDIVAWCLMPNHFHLLLRQKSDNGITRFMHKLGTGFTMYMNEKHERSGYLFQGPFKSALIDSDSYLLHITRYIHLNPVDLVEAGWEDKGIQDWNQVNKFLTKYRWSSYPDWIGLKNFPSIINLSSMQGLFRSPADYQEFMRSWALEEKERIIDYLFI